MAKHFSLLSKLAISQDHREASLSLLLLLHLLTVFIVTPLLDRSHSQNTWPLDALIAFMAFVSAFIITDQLRCRLAIFSFILCLIAFVLGPLLHDHIISDCSEI